MSNEPGVSRDSFGAMRPSGLHTYRAGETFADAMSAPTVVAQCVQVDARLSRHEFVIKNPASVTAFTVHYGRWVIGPSGLDGWLEDGTVDFATLGDDQLVSVTMDNHGDPAGVFVSDLSGTVDMGLSFQFWYRGRP